MKQLLLAAAVFGCCSAFSQKQIFRYKPPVWGGTFNTSFIADNQSNSFYFIVAGKEFVERIVVSPQGSKYLLHQGDETNENFPVNGTLSPAMQRFFFEKKYVDAFVYGTEMIEVLQYQSFYTYLVFVETNLTTGTSVSTDTVRITRPDDILFSCRRGKGICLVEKPKNKPYFLVHEKTFGSKTICDTLKIDLPAIGKVGNNIFGGSIDDFSDVAFGQNVQVLQNNLWLPVYAAASRNKAFVQSDKLQVVLNANDLSTWLLSLDLNALTYTLKRFQTRSNEVQTNAGAASNAAFVIDSFLITGFCKNKSLNYAVYNTNSGALLYTKTITEQNFADVGAGPVVKVGDFWSRSNLSEVSFNDFVNKAEENQLIIEGCRENDELFLTFGSGYKQFLSATTVGNLATLGMGGFTQAKPPATVYFHTSWQMPSFVATKKPAKDLVWDKMLNHVFAARLQQGFNAAYMKGFYYIGYFSIPKQEYQLYRFDEKME